MTPVPARSSCRLAIGTVQFGQSYGLTNSRGQVGPREVAAILAYALTAGVDTLDTAVIYGDAERILGEVGVAGFRVVSKVPSVVNASGSVSGWLREQVRASLQRLRVERLSGLLLHNPDDLLGPHAADIAKTMAEVVAEGWVDKVGVSVYTPGQLERLFDLMPIQLVQLPLSVFDRRFDEAGWLDRLTERGIEVHARSIFLQGLLLMDPASCPRSFAPWMPLIESWHDWLIANSRRPIDACVAHLASYPQISRCIVGCDGLDQLQEIIQAMRTPACRAPIQFAAKDASLLIPALWRNV